MFRSDPNVLIRSYFEASAAGICHVETLAQTLEMYSGISGLKSKSTGPKSRAFVNRLQTATSLLQRSAGRGRTVRRVVTNHTRLVGVETTRSGSALGNRVRIDRITSRRRAGACGERETIAALRPSCQNVVNQ